jgi:hypothetical protein
VGDTTEVYKRFLDGKMYLYRWRNTLLRLLSPEEVEDVVKAILARRGAIYLLEDNYMVLMTGQHNYRIDITKFTKEEES